jgi:hypothetical protein
MMSALESCRWVRTQLPRFLDGELASDLEARVSGHLDRCAACRAELAVERDLLLDTLELLSPTRPPQGMVDAVMARIAEEAAGAPAPTPVIPVLRPRRRAFGPSLAAAALLAFVVWAISGDNGGGAPSVGPSGPLAMLESGGPGPTVDGPDLGDLGTAISEEEALFGAENRSESTTIELVRFDVNADEQFDQRDLDALNRHLTEGIAIACPAAADVDEDGWLTPQDSIRAFQHFSTGEIEVSSAISRTVEYDIGGPLHCSYQACP